MFKGLRLIVFSGIFIGGISALASSPILGQPSNDSRYYRGSDSQTEITVQTVIDEVRGGDILVIGELHGMAPIQFGQLEILENLKNKGFKVSVGFEFLNYTDQTYVQSYVSGKISEEEFKSKIGWGKGTDFSYYRDQILLPQAALGERTIALNMPSRITRQISQQGLNSLSPADQALLPPHFTLGNSAYFERFSKVMGGHMPANKLDDYFAAQSMWDETMAWQTVEFVKKQKNMVADNHVFVIIVGEFHVQYRGGLPDSLERRLRQKGFEHHSVKTISQVWGDGLTEDQIKDAINPHNLYGERADYIWVGR